MTCKERLTIKYDGAFVPKELCTVDRNGDADDCDGCEDVCDNIYDDCEGCPVQKCFDRLGELEDKLENGTLIDVPCKVGDKVYIHCDTVKQIIPYEVQDIHIDNESTRFFATAFDIYYGEFLDEKMFIVDEIGKTVFLTKEEAEAGRKELQDD